MADFKSMRPLLIGWLSQVSSHKQIVIGQLGLKPVLVSTGYHVRFLLECEEFLQFPYLKNVVAIVNFGIGSIF